VLVVILAIALISLLIIFRKNVSKKMKNVMHGTSLKDDDYAEEEIISLVNESHEQGFLLDSEVEMIQNIFEFGDKDAKDIMIHRKSMIAIDGNLSYYDAVSFIVESGKSRFPVYVDDVDNVIGILLIKDAFALAQQNEIFRTSIKDIPGLIREAVFIPESLTINNLFQKMQTEKIHMCIVVDEYGQTSGIVAMEDILEEIVGNIEDEHDEEEDVVFLQSDGSYTVDGLTEFSDILEVIDLPIDEDAFDTLNGYLVSLLEEIPSDGEQYVLKADGYQFEICNVEERIIREVRISKLDNLESTDK
jgi:putative hemolysin